MSNRGESRAGRSAWRPDAGTRRLLTRVVVAAVLLTAVTVTAMVREIGQLKVRTTLGNGNASLSSSHQPASRPGSPTKGAPALPTTAPGPALTTSEQVAPVAQLHEPSALVTLPASVSLDLFKGIAGLKQVVAVELVDTGTVQLAGSPAMTIGVDPSSFRNFTPKASAGTDRLWQYIASKSLASSFEMAHERKFNLGASIAVVAPGTTVATSQWMGAFMSVGLPGVDLVVSRAMSKPLHLIPNGGLIVSAPEADPLELQSQLKSLAPQATVVLIRPGQAVGLTGSPTGAQGGSATVSAAQVSTMLAAATSKLGKPYVWGATGPNDFDCSGLVGWAFSAAGVSMPRTAAEQALSGPAVPLNRIQPGDLLFWAFDPADPGFIDHDAIYLGNGQMIEAPFTGSVVHIVPLNTSHLVGAVRVSPGIAARMGGAWTR